MGLGTFILQSINNSTQTRRVNKQIRQTVETVSETNYANRSVIAMPYVDKPQLLLTAKDDDDIYQYDATASSTPALDYIWGETDGPETVVVSGGSSADRSAALLPFVRKAQISNVPVVVIHSGDDDLMSMVDTNSVMHERIGKGHLAYDPFRGMTSEAIAMMLCDSMDDASRSYEAESLLRALSSMMGYLHGATDIHEMAAYRITGYIGDLDDLYDNGAMGEEERLTMSNNYSLGSSRASDVTSFLYRLDNQLRSVLGAVDGRERGNVRRGLNRKGVVSFDVGTSNNDFVLRLIVNHLLRYRADGINFAVLIDDVDVSRYSRIVDLISGNPFAISSSDFVASLSRNGASGDEMFAGIMGDVSHVVAFRHVSGHSAQKWSEYMGKYHKLKIKASVSSTVIPMPIGGIVSPTNGVQVEESDEPRVRAETISMLPDGIACIYGSQCILISKIEQLPD